MGDQFLKKLDVMYAHLCGHIIKFGHNNMIHSLETKIETSESNFIE